MKLKLLVFFVASLVVSLLGAPELILGSSEQIHHGNTNAMKVPSYLTDVTLGHFTGVSTPLNSLAEASQSAIVDLVRQILGTIGVKYSHHYFDKISRQCQNFSESD